jgi:hypothetical protein
MTRRARVLAAGGKAIPRRHTAMAPKQRPRVPPARPRGRTLRGGGAARGEAEKRENRYGLGVRGKLRKRIIKTGPHHWNPWLTCPALGQAVAAASKDLLASETPRKRQRTSTAKGNLDAIIGAVIANAAHATLIDADTQVVCPLAKRREALTRYQRRGFQKLPVIIKGLAVAGWLAVQVAGRKRGEASYFMAGPKLRDRLAAMGLSLADFTEASGSGTHHRKLYEGVGVSRRTDGGRGAADRISGAE